MNPETHETLRLSFIKLTPAAGMMIRTFYDRLFRETPSLKPLFANTDMAAHRTKMIRALAFVVENAGDPAATRPALEQLGVDHIAKGALMAHYPAVARALLDALRDGAQGDWNRELAAAWSEAISVVCDTMMSGVAKHYSGELTRRSERQRKESAQQTDAPTDRMRAMVASQNASGRGGRVRQ